jgi:hypothetical protein
MWDIVFWVYLTNAVLLILHEIDSAYWKEWELFRLPGGITAFLLVHIPILLLVLYGLVLVSQRTFAGLGLSLILGCGRLLDPCLLHPAGPGRVQVAHLGRHPGGNPCRIGAPGCHHRLVARAGLDLGVRRAV